MAGALSVVLVLVTLSAGESPHVSFSNAENAADCAAKGERLGAILTGAGYRIGAQACVETEARFAPYDHGASVFPHAYRVTVPAQGAASVEPLDRIGDCTTAPEADPAVWCALSAQAPLGG
ncbi:hypothetical protein [Paracoccus sanguinis]|uniref:hypothetical protein n=1 Tax=Paracoccus sanguinis TaxID=1545044 RepID=UPI00051FA0F8|nr:hypothetical protein [Paracoccus sanguinis]KGJ12905.1 hypothetical protein IX54_14555 [Paracoccus sanguinis]